MEPHEVLQQYTNHPKYLEIKELYVELIKTEAQASRIKETFEALYPMKEMRKKGAPVYSLPPSSGQFEGNTLDQIHTASKIPPALKAAVMPDGHPGYALPIGGVIALKNAISPSFVGYDIGCMMRLTYFSMDEKEFMKHRESLFSNLIKVTSFGLGAGFKFKEREHEVMEAKYWDENSFLKKNKTLAYAQLGSSGGGNHFANLGILEEGNTRLPFLLTHSGSRGVGHRTAVHYASLAEKQTNQSTRGVPRDYAWLDIYSDAGREYWFAMQLMGQYAEANHELIHKHFMKETGLEKLGFHANKHNFVWHEQIEVGGETHIAYVHRKGATPVHKGAWGIIPGTCGTVSYLVRGLGFPETMNSASHGAGRLRSRSASKQMFKERKFKRHMRKQDIIYTGIEGDEAPHAYKDIEEVIAPQEDKVFKVEAKLYPKAVVMGGRSDDGD